MQVKTNSTLHRMLGELIINMIYTNLDITVYKQGDKLKIVGDEKVIELTIDKSTTIRLKKTVRLAKEEKMYGKRLVALTN